MQSSPHSQLLLCSVTVTSDFTSIISDSSHLILLNARCIKYVQLKEQNITFTVYVYPVCIITDNCSSFRFTGN